MCVDEIRGLSVEKCTVPFGGKFSFVFPTNGKRSSRSILFMAKIALFHLAENSHRFFHTNGKRSKL